MQQPPTSFLDWTRRFATDEACLAELARRKWPGTFHGASKARLRESLDEFAFRFNRRFWEDQLPARLVEAAVTHVPVPFRRKHV